MPLLVNNRALNAASSCRATLCALLVVVALRANAAESGGKLVREYDLKAAFLFNFAHFVEWPSAAFADADSPDRDWDLG